MEIGNQFGNLLKFYDVEKGFYLSLDIMGEIFSYLGECSQFIKIFTLNKLIHEYLKKENYTCVKNVCFILHHGVLSNKKKRFRNPKFYVVKLKIDFFGKVISQIMSDKKIIVPVLPQPSADRSVKQKYERNVETRSRILVVGLERSIFQYFPNLEKLILKNEKTLIAIFGGVLFVDDLFIKLPKLTTLKLVRIFRLRGHCFLYLKRLKRLYMKGCRHFEISTLKFLPRCLEVFESEMFWNMRVNSGILQESFQSTNLKRLKLVCCDIRDFFLSQFRDSLEVLSIESCKEIEGTFFDTFSALKNLTIIHNRSVKDENIVKIKNLRMLKLSLCSEITGRGLSELRDLRRLAIFCENFSEFDQILLLDKFVDFEFGGKTCKNVLKGAVISKMSNLERIYLNKCDNINDNDLVNMKKLSCMKLTSCDKITDKIFVKLKKLRIIEIDKCKRISGKNFCYLSQLHSLKFSNSEAFTDQVLSTLKKIQLEKLELYKCSKVSHKSIYELKYLRKLSLSFCDMIKIKEMKKSVLLVKLKYLQKINYF